jgi:hypothetical protein
MEISLIQFPAIRWSILIAFGSYLATPQLASNKGVVSLTRGIASRYKS